MNPESLNLFAVDIYFHSLGKVSQNFVPIKKLFQFRNILIERYVV